MTALAVLDEGLAQTVLHPAFLVLRIRFVALVPALGSQIKNALILQVLTFSGIFV